MENRKKSLGFKVWISWEDKDRLDICILISVRGACIQYSSIITPCPHSRSLTHMVPALA